LRNAEGLNAYHDPAVVEYYARARRYSPSPRTSD
jgi:hypothetical protein